MNNKSDNQAPISVGLIGCGTVGQGVVKLLQEQADQYTQRVGRPIEIRKILVRNLDTPRNISADSTILTTNPDDVLDDDAIQIIVEVAGGLDPVGQYVQRALAAGKHVITANKSLLAAQGSQLFRLARKNSAAIAFEASCGGGIPILAAIKFGLAANRIKSVFGVLNGTCNYILTQMTDNGASYADALADAQELGFAEADPTLDVTGADAAQKLAIIASLAFGVSVDESHVTHEGINNLELEDIFYGAELGYQIKLLAVARQHPAGLQLNVCPCFIHIDQPLAQVRGSYNALSVFGHAVGQTMYIGHGAGQMPTASAVVSDLINVAGGWYPHAFGSLRIWPDQQQPTKIISPDELTSRYYLRLLAKDQPGVVAAVTNVLGQNGISISALLQHESAEATLPDYVPLVITTHEASESAVRTAAQQIEQLDYIAAKPVCIRILDLPED